MYHNRTSPPPFLSFASSSNFYCNIVTLVSYRKEHGDCVMFLFHVATNLSLFLLFIHFSSFLLTKIFTYLYHDHKEIFHGDLMLTTTHDKYEFDPATATDKCDILSGETLTFLHRECDTNDCLLIEQCEDSKRDDTLVSESEYDSPLEDLPHENIGTHLATTTFLEAKTDHHNKVLQKSEEHEDLPKDEENERLDTNKNSHSGSEKLQVEEVQEDSTSESSAEWRSSRIFKDSETDHSSSRRSSSRWESYALFRKYDDDMLFFDRITEQNLSETESFRSTKVHYPRSISKRILHRLSTTPVNYSMGRRDPYQELECAYVAQICLTWEALNWTYINFQQKKYSKNESFQCPSRIAQQFQQFQVLMQRFIENEPYEYGRRPEVYARRRISSPKLLQVPEFREGDDQDKEDETTSNIASFDFVVILEDSIHTFMNFLKADKEKCGDKVRAFIKRKSTSADPIFHQFLKKANKKKKLRLKNIGGQHPCIRKRQLKHEEEMEILMALIDLKVASRVLRMSQINNEQMHWCEEKMTRVRVWDGKMQRDSSLLFFPVHGLHT